MKNFVIGFILLLGLNVGAQDSAAIDSLFTYLNEGKFKEASAVTIENTEINNIREKLIKVILLDDVYNPTLLDESSYSEDQKVNKCIINLINGYSLISFTDRRTDAYRFLRKAYEQSKEIKNIKVLRFALLSLLEYYKKGSLQNDATYVQYLKAYKELIDKPTHSFLYNSYLSNLQSQQELYNDTSKRASLFDQLQNKQDVLYPKIKKNSFLKSIYNYEKGNFLVKRDPTRALDLYNRSLNDTNRLDNLFINTYDFLLNRSRAYAVLNQNEKGLEDIYRSKNQKTAIDTNIRKLITASYAGDYHLSLKRYDSALFYMREARYLGYEFNFQKHNTEVSKIKVALDTAEKEKENLILNAQRNRNKTIAIALGVSLLLLSTIGILSYLNIKRKQRIAEQEKELEVQKTSTLLKEQEINTINAMVQGQEKERLRIARDLHDDLGGTLAAVKMHIGNLQTHIDRKENPEQLLEKLNDLTSIAYNRVRSIAHERNVGVMADKGLVPAIKSLTEKISSARNLEISFETYGLTNRISNNLEITIFRFVQELITNIIKHAYATEATISMTQHDKELNIIVEDNGRGFKVGKLVEKDGMGLGSIERRVEFLEGTMEVDSTIGRGTHIIIDIPL